MKRKTILHIILIFLFGTTGTAGTVQAQSGAGYNLSWWTIDAGGGQNFTGGAYTLSATVGQPDAATLNGSGYTLQGGFWGAGISGSVVKPPTFRVLLPFLRR